MQINSIRVLVDIPAERFLRTHVTRDDARPLRNREDDDDDDDRHYLFTDNDCVFQAFPDKNEKR